MKAAFADTFYFLALLNARDPAHERAIAASNESDQSFVTTEFVLLELADALSKPPLREEVRAVCALIQSTPSFHVVPASTGLLHRGLALDHDRPDKAWQLNCRSCSERLVPRSANAAPGSLKRAAGRPYPLSGTEELAPCRSNPVSCREQPASDLARVAPCSPKHGSCTENPASGGIDLTACRPRSRSCTANFVSCSPFRQSCTAN
jgi:hypothetical protein